jgi:hypothetical protein
MGVGCSHRHDPATSYALKKRRLMAKSKRPTMLTINLVGRICLVWKDGQAWAVFLKANKDSRYHTRRGHMPAMNLSLHRVKRQSVADQSKMVIGSVGNLGGKPLADSVGVWSLSNYDMRIQGVRTDGPGARRTKNVADLNAIVQSVRAPSDFEPRILSKDPRPYGIVARLRIPKGATISGVVEDPVTRTFQPGGYAQVLADFIRVRIPFATPSKGPTLRLARFGAKKSQSFKFQANAGDLTLTMSNLCQCVEQPAPPTPSGNINEDREFVVYYKLLRTPLPPKRRPAPQVPLSSITTGIDVPECYRPGEIDF